MSYALTSSVAGAYTYKSEPVLDLSYEHGTSQVYRYAEGSANTFTIAAGIKIP